MPEIGNILSDALLRQTKDLILKDRKLTESARSNDRVPQEQGRLFKLDESGETVPSYGVFIGDDTDGDWPYTYLIGKQPSTTFSRNICVNGFKPVEHGKWGRLQKTVDGTYFLAYDPSATPTPGKTYGPKPGEWAVFEGYSGFRCVGIWSAERHIMVAVRDEPQFYLCKPDSNISKGSSGTVSVYNGAEPPVDTTINVTAKALFDAVTSGKWCSLTFYGGVARVGKVEC